MMDLGLSKRITKLPNSCEDKLGES